MSLKVAQSQAEKAQKIADKAAADVVVITAFEPHIPNPRYLFAARLYSAASAAWEVETLAEVVDIMSQLPPIPVTVWTDGCTNRQPADTAEATAARANWEKLPKQHDSSWWIVARQFGESRVYQQAEVHWYADTPAGRVSCKVTVPSRLLVRFEARYQTHGRRRRLVKTEAYTVNGMRAKMNGARYYSGSPGGCHYTFEAYDGEPFAAVIPA